MKTIILTEEQLKLYTEAKDVLSEVVYVNGVKGNKAMLSYDKTRSRGSNKYVKNDKLGTDKMNQMDADTYEVPLKGGIMSYNITDIDGTHVMHYFKNYFNNKKEIVSDGDKNQYELDMEANEFNSFMNDFKAKVWRVISYAVKGFQVKDRGFKPVGISLYPVPSSSNFNIEMCDMLEGGSIGGLSIEKISPDLFVKDLRNLEIDKDFVKKNKNFYNSEVYQNPSETEKGTYLQKTQDVVNKMKRINEIEGFIDRANQMAKKLYKQWNNIKSLLKTGRKTVGEYAFNSMANNYAMFCDCMREIKKRSNFVSSVSGDNKRINKNSIWKGIGSGGNAGWRAEERGVYPKATEKRSDEMWEMVEPYLKGRVSEVDGQPYKREDVLAMDRIAFEIKDYVNGIRMGLKNIYNPNKDEEFIKGEVAKTMGTVFVIFDDNISGGATLSDVCYQAKQLGIGHIIPITFGKMAEGHGGYQKPINVPINDKGEKGFNLNEKSGDQ